MRFTSGRRINSAGANGWSALTRLELEERFSAVVSILRKVCSDRYVCDKEQCRAVLEAVLSSPSKKKRKQQ